MKRRTKKNANCDLRVRVTEDLRIRVEAAAAAETRSISNFIICVLEAYLAAKARRSEP